MEEWREHQHPRNACGDEYSRQSYRISVICPIDSQSGSQHESFPSECQQLHTLHVSSSTLYLPLFSQPHSKHQQHSNTTVHEQQSTHQFPTTTMTTDLISLDVQDLVHECPSPKNPNKPNNPTPPDSEQQAQQPPEQVLTTSSPQTITQIRPFTPSPRLSPTPVTSSPDCPSIPPPGLPSTPTTHSSPSPLSSHTLPPPPAPPSPIPLPDSEDIDRMLAKIVADVNNITPEESARMREGLTAEDLANFRELSETIEYYMGGIWRKYLGWGGGGYVEGEVQGEVDGEVDGEVREEQGKEENDDRNEHREEGRKGRNCETQEPHKATSLPPTPAPLLPSPSPSPTLTPSTSQPTPPSPQIPLISALSITPSPSPSPVPSRLVSNYSRPRPRSRPRTIAPTSQPSINSSPVSLYDPNKPNAPKAETDTESDHGWRTKMKARVRANVRAWKDMWEIEKTLEKEGRRCKR
ncbi:hypothetical protein K491DRAFT_239283 [Lophiostoma macrostomum CBS 122681]|uniref:Uncharacterized protein n=1 Tax=Lophiostoma macrostomum CBS 122681 TaxID=1314788 RepID=A0A6A6SLS0_9PLEO|nr:hypothetical protein K491DRAFT_239283 [Lophiostoma macrostomum CBS 122681]